MAKKRQVKFSLLFRDMWQSAGKSVPRVDQLVRVAPAMVKMEEFLGRQQRHPRLLDG